MRAQKCIFDIMKMTFLFSVHSFSYFPSFKLKLLSRKKAQIKGFLLYGYLISSNSIKTSKDFYDDNVIDFN